MCPNNALMPCRGLLDTGEGFEGSRMAYRDRAAQAVLASIYDANVIQAIGRARPLLRTAADPVEIICCGNVPLLFPVASIGRLRPVTKLETVIASPSCRSAAPTCTATTPR
jgi:hypothetical protein